MTSIERTARRTALCGLGVVLLLLIGMSLGGSVPDTSEAGAARELAEFWGKDGNQDKALLAAFLGFYTAFLLIWFAAGLRTILRHADPEGSAATAAVAGGVVAAVLLVASIVLHSAVGITLRFSDDYRLDTNYAILVENTSYFLWAGALVGVGVLALATSLVARGQGFLPTWVVWFGFVLTAVALTGPFFAFFGFLLFPLWLAAVSINLLTRRALLPGGAPDTA